MRGVYRTSKRSPEPCVVDSRGQSVRSLEMAQTFLTDAEVDELVAAYEAGATLRGLAKQFHIHRLTAAAHLARRGVPVRRVGLDSAQSKEAARLYQAVGRSCSWAAGSRWTHRPCIEPSHVRECRSGQVDDHVGVTRRTTQQPDLFGTRPRSCGCSNRTEHERARSSHVVLRRGGSTSMSARRPPRRTHKEENLPHSQCTPPSCIPARCVRAKQTDAEI